MAEKSGADIRTLLVEDDGTLRQGLAALVRQRGHLLKTVETGEAGAAACAEALPDLLLVDWILPGFSGIELVQQVRSRPGGDVVAVVMMTGRTEPEALDEALAAGVDDYIPKPAGPGAIATRLTIAENLVRERRALQAARRELETRAGEMQSLAEERGRQLVHSDRLAALGTLACGVAHEISNALSYLSGHVQTQQKLWPDIEAVLRQANPEDQAAAARVGLALAEVPGMLRGMRQGLDRVRQIVHGLNQYARQDDGGTGAADLNQAVRDALELCSAELRYCDAVDPVLAPSLPPVAGNAQELTQVAVNLITNAIDAMRGGRDGALVVRTGRAAEAVAFLAVEDTGIGIPESSLEAVFQPFMTTKPKGRGTGLGLSICRGIVERAGGTIKARNREAGGASFVVTLPLLGR